MFPSDNKTPSDKNSGASSLLILKKVDTNFIYLSLFLILFTFFIFLNAISTVEKTKAEKGIESVKTAFKGDKHNKKLDTGELMRGFVKGGNFDQKIQGVFQNLMPKQAYNKRGQGESIEIVVKLDRVFSKIEPPQVSDKGLILLEKIVNLLKEPVQGKAVELAVLVGRTSKGPFRSENKFYGEKPGAMMMGLVGRTMTKFGIENEVFSVGFHDGDPEEMIFKFRRAVEE